jgi:hypothetical protein
MGMYQIVIERKYDSKRRLFGLCESCYWTATILRNIESYECPVCKSREVALIPLAQNEKYDYGWNSKNGLQIKFSARDRMR